MGPKNKGKQEGKNKENLLAFFLFSLPLFYFVKF